MLRTRRGMGGWRCKAGRIGFLLKGSLFAFVSISLFFYSVNNVCAQIPREAAKHRSALIRVAREVWGLDAPAALFAAQIHAESFWDSEAASHVGAQGLAQFMPATAAWLPTVAPDTGEPLPFNPAWSLRALVTYDLWLWRLVDAYAVCDRTAFMLSAYNGGLSWVKRDKLEAQRQGADPKRYWGHVEHANAGRRPSAFEENRNYSKRILHTLQKLYENSGWGQGVDCDHGI